MSISGVSGSAGLIWQQISAGKSAAPTSSDGTSPLPVTAGDNTSSPGGSVIKASETAARPTLSTGMMNGLLNAQEQDSGTTASNGDVHNMTNAELVSYAKSHGLGDIAESFQVDYVPMDRSAAGEAAFYSSLMSDPTKHDFVAQYLEAAQWQQQQGSSDGGEIFQRMADELISSSAKDASVPSS